MSEQFSLKWSDFHTNVSKSFGLLRNETYLHDVTLVSDDFKQIAANKLVLVACSEFFKNILKETKEANPLLCLDGINSVDLQNVLEYIYQGEVKLYQENLDRFMSVAEKLKIEGLMSSATSEPDDPFESQESFKDKDLEPFNSEDNVIAELLSETQNSTQDMKLEPEVLIDDNVTSEGKHQKILNDNVTRNPDGSVSCNLCGRQFSASRRDNSLMMAKRHVEVHLQGLTYQCLHCDKTSSTKRSLQAHIKRSHN